MMDTPTVNLAGTQAQGTKQQNLDDMGKVVFEQLTKTSEDIDYDSETGTFTLHASATYLVNWNVAIDGSLTTPFVRFALEANGTLHGPSVLPTTWGALSGASLVTVETPTALSLVNCAGDVVQFSPIPPAAHITITKVTGIDTSEEQVFNELIYSIALEETALAHILYAEGEKIRAALKMDGITIADLLQLNASVESTIDSVAKLESTLVTKLKRALAHGKEC
jgi:hypothetical protein